MDKVFIEKCSEYKNSKNALLSILSNFECLKKINSKSKVLIKANLVSALPPEKGATTNYLLLSFLVEYLKIPLSANYFLNLRTVFYLPYSLHCYVLRQSAIL